MFYYFDDGAQWGGHFCPEREKAPPGKPGEGDSGGHRGAVGRVSAEDDIVRLYVQRRLACSAGVNPAGVKARGPVA